MAIIKTRLLKPSDLHVGYAMDACNHHHQQQQLCAAVEGIFALIPVQYDSFNIEVDDFVDGGDKIVMVGHYTGIYKATGKKFKANATHTWTIKNGKIVKLFQAVDTAEIINP